MKIIKPSVEILDEDISNLRRIELAGRVCYKSEDKISDDSAKTFVNNIIKRGHEAVLEHGTLIYEIEDYDLNFFMANNKYLNYTYSDGRKIVSGNIRAWRDFLSSYDKYFVPAFFKHIIINNSIFFPEFKFIKLLDKETFNGEYFKELNYNDLNTIEEQMKHHRVSVRFICDRAIANEIVRHRPASYCQESTRYCNYSNKKFNNEITVISPLFYNTDSYIYLEWEDACKQAEKSYFKLLDNKVMPQEARSILPHSLKTELIMTADLEEWHHFLTLRCDTTAHPQMRQLTLPLLDEFKKRFIGFDDILTQ